MPVKKEKRTMNLTCDDVKHIVRLATAVRYPEISQEGFDWTGTEMLYQNALPDNYNLLERLRPEIKNVKWGKEIEVNFKTTKNTHLTLRIQANGQVSLESGMGNATTYSNPLPIASFLINKGYPLVKYMGDETAQQFA